MKFLYVAGYARVGSTFLDSALGSHPDVFSAGELTHLFDDASSEAPCACGETVPSCPVWSGVLNDAGVEPAHASRLTRHCERAVRGIQATSGDLREYEDIWSRVITSISNRTGNRVIVDASKSMQFVARRATRIRRIFPHAFALAHLTRDPRASAWSVRKGGNPIAANRRFKSLAPWRTAATWTVANIVAEASAQRTRSVQLGYEELVDDPEAALARISELVPVDLTAVADDLLEGRELPVGHGISGNRMRRGGPVTLKPDTDWQESAPRSVRTAATLTAPVARRYGYRLGPAGVR